MRNCLLTRTSWFCVDKGYRERDNVHPSFKEHFDFKIEDWGKRSRLSVIPYTGGKAGLVPDLVPLIEGLAKEHNLKGYIEATGGGGRLLLNIETSLFKQRIYNDMDYSLCCLFAVLRDKHLTRELFKKLNRQDYCYEVFEKALLSRKLDNQLAEIGLLEEVSNMVHSAANTYVLAQQSFRSNMKSYGWSLERKKKENYFNKLFNLQQFPQIMSGVDVYWGDCRKLINKYKDQKDYLIYVDPPYDPKSMKSEKHYQYSWSREDHEEFVGCLVGLQCFLIVSGYASDIYDSLLEKGFRKIFVKNKHVASSGTSRTEAEYIYINF